MKSRVAKKRYLFGKGFTSFLLSRKGQDSVFFYSMLCDLQILLYSINKGPSETDIIENSLFVNHDKYKNFYSQQIIGSRFEFFSPYNFLGSNKGTRYVNVRYALSLKPITEFGTNRPPMLAFPAGNWRFCEKQSFQKSLFWYLSQVELLKAGLFINRSTKIVVPGKREFFIKQKFKASENEYLESLLLLHAEGDTLLQETLMDRLGGYNNFYNSNLFEFIRRSSYLFNNRCLALSTRLVDTLTFQLMGEGIYSYFDFFDAGLMVDLTFINWEYPKNFLDVLPSFYIWQIFEYAINDFVWLLQIEVFAFFRDSTLLTYSFLNSVRLLFDPKIFFYNFISEDIWRKQALFDLQTYLDEDSYEGLIETDLYYEEEEYKDYEDDEDVVDFDTSARLELEDYYTGKFLFFFCFLLNEQKFDCNLLYAVLYLIFLNTKLSTCIKQSRSSYGFSKNFSGYISSEDLLIKRRFKIFQDSKIETTLVDLDADTNSSDREPPLLED